MSDLSAEVIRLLGMRGLETDRIANDLTDIINRGVIKAEKAARVEALTEARKEICQGFGRGINIVLNREFDKLIEATNANS